MSRCQNTTVWTLRASPAERAVIEDIIEHHKTSISDAIRECIKAYSNEQEEAARLGAMERRLAKRIDVLGGLIRELILLLQAKTGTQGGPSDSRPENS